MSFWKKKKGLIVEAARSYKKLHTASECLGRLFIALNGFNRQACSVLVYQ